MEFVLVQMLTKFLFLYYTTLFLKSDPFILFIYFWLYWVLVTASGLSLISASGGLLLVGVRGPLIAVASLAAKHQV